MRTIKFRGKDSNGEWHYGNLEQGVSDNGIEMAFIAPEIPFVITAQTYIVDPETVGEFTGLQDANGTDVYEGDIVRYRPNNKTYQVVFKDGIFWGEGENGCGCAAHFFPSCEIVGNIHDNPELLEKGGEL